LQSQRDTSDAVDGNVEVLISFSTIKYGNVRAQKTIRPPVLLQTAIVHLDSAAIHGVSSKIKDTRHDSKPLGELDCEHVARYSALTESARYPFNIFIRRPRVNSIQTDDMPLFSQTVTHVDTSTNEALREITN
jgi:hypothetical protein